MWRDWLKDLSAGNVKRRPLNDAQSVKESGIVQESAKFLTGQLTRKNATRDQRN